MLELLKSNWWLLALRGVLAIVFGILALVWPQITTVFLVLLFGAYALVDGLITAIVSIKDRADYRNWWVFLLEGLAGILAGILTFIWPKITALVLVYLIAIWAVLTGILELIAAIALREEIRGELLLAFTGVLSIILGIVLFVQPESGLLGIIVFVGVYAILFGLLLIALAFRLRGILQTYESQFGS
jgi:uncharacterized membrane protein HdeD (DUF308 family)